MIPKHYGFVRNGILKMPNSFHEYLKRFDGTVCVTVDIPKSRRTNQMNAYLWGVVYKLISEETGYECEQIHELMKSMFGLKEDIYIKERRFEKTIIISTTKYTVQEMQEYWRKITQWAAEFLSLYIPEPNEMSLET